MFDYSEAADDFFVNLNLQTTLALPNSREGILHFFEAVQRDFRAMASFYQRETGEYVLESNRQDGSYSWLELETNHMTAGFFNPPSLEEAYRLHRWLLDRSEAPEGGIVTFQVKPAPGVSLDVGVHDTAGERLVGGTDIVPPEITTFTYYLDPGTYYVRVSSPDTASANARDPYTLTVLD